MCHLETIKCFKLNFDWLRDWVGLCYIVRLLYCSSAVAQDLLFRSSPTGPAIETTNQDDPMIFVGQFSSNGADANDRKNHSIYVLMSRDKSGTKRLNCVCRWENLKACMHM